MASTIGLDIGTSAVRAVQLSGGRGPATLERLGQVMLPPGAVRDGEVVDVEQVAEAIRLLWSQYGFKGRKVAVGVANQQVVVRQMDLPALPRDQMAESLPYQVQDFIPIPIDQAQLDFQVLRDYQTDEGVAMQRVLVVAAATEMVETVMTVLARAKLTPVMLDLEAFALMRTLAQDGEGSGADSTVGEMLVNVGAGVTNIVVHSHGVPRFVRILLMGGNVVTDALVNTSGITWEQAEAFKMQPSTQPGAEAQLVADRCDRFVAELRGSLDYYRAQTDAVQVQRIVLTGGGSMLAGLPEKLAQAVRLPVDRGHPMQQLRIGKVPLTPEQLAEAEPFVGTAVGLALGAME